MPVIPPKSDEIKAVLTSLKQADATDETLRCVYCGNHATEWDHLHPVVKDGGPTGYLSEINNLVPCCGTCNQSKGNKDWAAWINSNAKKSPRFRNPDGLLERVKILNQHEKRFPVSRIDTKDITNLQKYKDYLLLKHGIFTTMSAAQKLADEIRLETQKNYQGKA